MASGGGGLPWRQPPQRGRARRGFVGQWSVGSGMNPGSTSHRGKTTSLIATARLLAPRDDTLLVIARSRDNATRQSRGARKITPARGPSSATPCAPVPSAGTSRSPAPPRAPSTAGTRSRRRRSSAEAPAAAARGCRSPTPAGAR